MFSDKPLDQLDQWEIEQELGDLHRALMRAQSEASELERQAGQRRAEETELLAAIREHRQQLGLEDTPIVRRSMLSPRRARGASASSTETDRKDRYGRHQTPPEEA